jgi:hypothetical protein
LFYTCYIAEFIFISHIIPEVKVEDYEEIMALQTKLSAGSNMHQIESLQNVSTEKTQSHDFE